MSVMDREDERRSYDIVAFIVTALLYLGIGGIVWYMQHRITVSDEIPKIHKIDLKLSAFSEESSPHEQQKPQQIPATPSKTEPPAEVLDPTPTKEETHKDEAAEVLKAQKKHAEPVIEKLIEAKKHIEKKAVRPRPKPKVTKHRKKKRKHQTRKHNKSALAKYTKSAKSKHRKKVQKQSAQASAASTHYSAAAKNHFLAEVRRKIDRYKSYPRIAKKRRMQGTVKVHFTILPSGQVSAVSVEGPKVFLRSARQAVTNAFPVSVKDIPMHLPTTVNITLRYQLR